MKRKAPKVRSRFVRAYLVLCSLDRLAKAYGQRFSVGFRVIVHSRGAFRVRAVAADRVRELEPYVADAVINVYGLKGLAVIERGGARGLVCRKGLRRFGLAVGDRFDVVV